jgi:uncharacterized glyoxalase superfamily protein PhnB
MVESDVETAIKAIVGTTGTRCWLVVLVASVLAIAGAAGADSGSAASAAPAPALKTCPPGYVDEDEETAMFRFKDTYVLLQRGAAQQDGPSGDVLSLAQKGVGQFVIFVEDVDAVRAELDQHQVTVISGPTDRDWGMRTLTLADPGGYTWEITQELPSSS